MFPFIAFGNCIIHCLFRFVKGFGEFFALLPALLSAFSLLLIERGAVKPPPFSLLPAVFLLEKCREVRVYLHELALQVPHKLVLRAGGVLHALDAAVLVLEIV